MRIIAGEFRSRRIYSPPDDAPTRPITDRVKETIFNVLRGHVENAEILDLFAGVGSMGLEAISRGAARCLFVEQSRVVARVLQANIDMLGVQDRAEVHAGDALSPALLARLRRPPHLIFLDPPYDFMNDPRRSRAVLDQMARLAKAMDADGYLVLRTPWPLAEGVSIAHPELAGPETSTHGGMAVHLYQPASR